MLDELTRDLLERYIDGELAAPERQAFEARLAREPALQEALARQRRIEVALRRNFHAPLTPARSIVGAGAAAVAVAADGARAETAAGSKHDSTTSASDGISAAPADAAPATLGRITPPLNPWLRRLAVAAVLAVGVFGAWQIRNYLNPLDNGPVPTVQLLTAAQYYNHKMAEGFQPLWVCDDDVEFAHTFRYRFGQPLLLKPSDSADVRMLGLDYTHVLSASTVSMLGEAGGKQVVVIVDRVAADKPVHIASGCGSGNLHTFRREVGNLVLYEISPLDQPHFLDLLYQPEG